MEILLARFYFALSYYIAFKIKLIFFNLIKVKNLE